MFFFWEWRGLLVWYRKGEERVGRGWIHTSDIYPQDLEPISVDALQVSEDVIARLIYI